MNEWKSKIIYLLHTPIINAKIVTEEIKTGLFSCLGLGSDGHALRLNILLLNIQPITCRYILRVSVHQSSPI